uniref:ADP-ribosylation factor n=1 Tax=Chromera velia CCMP2878 TaxID=1169474 RepID=A0A0G4IDP6_9ALVE|eukprot:Cvel_13354.t1-p1 / transcript=Cvel_13354.t1 / gene=Cvel_13354 / organism=Chromera_velia_CCMP2878 / gene_product=ADP-ribosylation factor 1, putative / transcript_product=ADP-ribosylation factor 1, putative / location=Cvel_scaffold907:23180-24060(-) / protein_length=224 / sequence_SO=supercontig / SO=protein_coding / is_pseudo=false
MGNCVPFSVNKTLPHLFLCGPSGAGKTTLLYRLKIPDMNAKSLEDLGPSEGVHYEELTKKGFGKFGVWDVPGNAAARDLWNVFYRSIDMSAVIFMVRDAEGSLNGKDILEARESLKVLLSETELRDACFCILVNMWDEKSNDKLNIASLSVRDKEEHEAFWWERLDIESRIDMELSEEAGKAMRQRVKIFLISAKDIDLEEQWKPPIEFIQEHVQRKQKAELLN